MATLRAGQGLFEMPFMRKGFDFGNINEAYLLHRGRPSFKGASGKPKETKYLPQHDYVYDTAMSQLRQKDQQIRNYATGLYDKYGANVANQDEYYDVVRGLQLIQDTQQQLDSKRSVLEQSVQNYNATSAAITSDQSGSRLALRDEGGYRRPVIKGANKENGKLNLYNRRQYLDKLANEAPADLATLNFGLFDPDIVTNVNGKLSEETKDWFEAASKNAQYKNYTSIISQEGDNEKSIMNTFFEKTGNNTYVPKDKFGAFYYLKHATNYSNWNNLTAASSQLWDNLSTNAKEDAYMQYFDIMYNKGLSNTLLIDTNKENFENLRDNKDIKLINNAVKKAALGGDLTNEENFYLEEGIKLWSGAKAADNRSIFYDTKQFSYISKIDMPDKDKGDGTDISTKHNFFKRVVKNLLQKRGTYQGKAILATENVPGAVFNEEGLLQGYSEVPYRTQYGTPSLFMSDIQVEKINFPAIQAREIFKTGETWENKIKDVDDTDQIESAGQTMGNTNFYDPNTGAFFDLSDQKISHFIRFNGEAMIAPQFDKTAGGHMKHDLQRSETDGITPRMAPYIGTRVIVKKEDLMDMEVLPQMSVDDMEISASDWYDKQDNMQKQMFLNPDNWKRVQASNWDIIKTVVKDRIFEGSTLTHKGIRKLFGVDLEELYKEIEDKYIYIPAGNGNKGESIVIDKDDFELLQKRGISPEDKIPEINIKIKSQAVNRMSLRQIAEDKDMSEEEILSRYGQSWNYEVVDKTGRPKELGGDNDWIAMDLYSEQSAMLEEESTDVRKDYTKSDLSEMQQINKQLEEIQRNELERQKLYQLFNELDYSIWNQANDNVGDEVRYAYDDNGRKVPYNSISDTDISSGKKFYDKNGKELDKSTIFQMRGDDFDVNLQPNKDDININHPNYNPEKFDINELNDQNIPVITINGKRYSDPMKSFDVLNTLLRDIKEGTRSNNFNIEFNTPFYNEENEDFIKWRERVEKIIQSELEIINR